MPTTLSRVFTSVIGYPSSNNKHLPMINSISNSLSGYLSAVGQISKKRVLMQWYKQIPELTGLVNKVAKDIVYKYHFEPSTIKETGRNKILSANKFSAEVSLRKVMLAQVIDGLVTGDMFGWLGTIKDEQLRTKISDLVKNKYLLETKEKHELFEKVYAELKQTGKLPDSEFDEDLLTPRKYRYLPSSTMEIMHDQFDISMYRHQVGMNTIDFKPDEIIHYTLMDVDGKPNGFSCVESIVVQLELLRFMWQNMVSMHKNGGAPDKLFILENVQPNSPAYKNIEQQLQKYQLVENKHGNMLFTGKVTVEDLQQLDKMQFMDMGLYITGLIAMQWGIPRSSIPYIVGGTNTQDDTGGNSEKGYWRNVEFAQQIFADTMNSQLWIPYFGVKIVFDNTFVQQDVQLETAWQLRLGNIQSINSILQTSGKQLSLPKKLELLEINDEDLEDDMGLGLGMNTLNNQLSSNEVNNSDSQQNIAKRKKTEQTNIAARGMASTTGVGKLSDAKAELEYKTILGNDDEIVDYDIFIRLYNEDKAYHPGMPPRIFMKKNDMFTTFRYKSSDFVYKTVVNNEDLDTNKISFMNLGSNIYRV